MVCLQSKSDLFRLHEASSVAAAIVVWGMRRLLRKKRFAKAVSCQNFISNVSDIGVSVPWTRAGVLRHRVSSRTCVDSVDTAMNITNHAKGN